MNPSTLQVHLLVLIVFFFFWWKCQVFLWVILLLLLSCPSVVSPICNPMNCRPPHSSVHGIIQAIILGWFGHALHQGIFLTQKSNLCLLSFLPWQECSLPQAPPTKPHDIWKWWQFYFFPSIFYFFFFLLLWLGIPILS